MLRSKLCALSRGQAPQEWRDVGIRTWCRLCAIAAPILLPIGAEGELDRIDYASFVLFF